MSRREEVIPAPLVTERKRLPWYLDVWVRLAREKPLGMIGGGAVLVMLLMAILADVVAPYGYNETSLMETLRPPSRIHFFGTDDYGRDLFSRILYGARVSLYVGLGSVAISTVLAVILGIASAYFGGAVDNILQRIVDAWMSFPTLVILLTLMAIMGPGLLNIIWVLGVTTCFANSRVVRGAALSIKENVYMEAAAAIGASNLRRITYHLLPNIMAPIIVIGTINLGALILAEASLSFLGFGVPPPNPSWGGMLSGKGMQYMILAPWMAIWPGLFLTFAVFGFNMLGDGLRDLLDPRLRGATGRFAGRV